MKVLSRCSFSILITNEISLQHRYWCTTGAQGSRPSYQSHESDDNHSHHEMNADDIDDDLDLDPDVPTISAANLRPYACFLADIPDWSDMSQANYTKAFEALL